MATVSMETVLPRSAPMKQCILSLCNIYPYTHSPNTEQQKYIVKAFIHIAVFTSKGQIIKSSKDTKALFTVCIRTFRK